MKLNFVKLSLLGLMLVLVSTFANAQAISDHTNIAINSTNFPDGNFRQYISENFDTSLPKDNVLSDEEIAAVNSIDISKQNIKRLDGVGFFSSLKNLNCSSNALESLDLSKNAQLEQLVCYGNKLSKLRLQQNQNLNFLDCCQNKLIELKLNTNLSILCCHDNNLSSLDTKNNPALSHLECHNNQISVLELDNNLELSYLNCSNNKLKQLNVSPNIKLSYLNCEGNLLSQLDTSCNILLPSDSEVKGNETNAYLADNQTVSAPVSMFLGKYRLRLSNLVGSKNTKNVISSTLNGSEIPVKNKTINLGNISPKNSNLSYTYLTAANTQRYMTISVNLYEKTGSSFCIPILILIPIVLFTLLWVIRRHFRK